MKTLFRLVLTTMLATAATSAAANDRINWSVSIGNPGPVYVQSAPSVVYQRAPVPAHPSYVYNRPAPVYVQPAPVVTYVVPRGHHRSHREDAHWRKHERRHGYHHHGRGRDYDDNRRW